MLSILQAAGWTIWPLLLCSIVAVAVVIERLASLRRARVVPPRLADEVVAGLRQHLPAPEAVVKLEQGSLLGFVFACGIRALIVDGRVTEEGLRGAFESAGRVAIHRMERYLNTLGTVASAAPLLGLMGTVVGMIEIFGAQAPGSGQPAQLAHGISVALYNTAFGLMVAIPSLMFYRYFRGLIDAWTLELEQAADRAIPVLLRHAPPTGRSTAAGG